MGEGEGIGGVRVRVSQYGVLRTVQSVQYSRVVGGDKGKWE